MSERFERVAVVNRGEAAIRFLRTARERALHTIAVHTDEDARSWFVQLADEAVSIGPALAVDPATGRQVHAYLDHDRLEAALRRCRAEAVWPGWGFVAEDPDFVERCDRLGITFIGPTAAAMRQLGDKVAAKQLAERAGVDVVPWSGGALLDPGDASAIAARLGYPLVVKASAGGGGRGIRVVTAPDELHEAVAAAAREARATFGDGSVFMEAMVTTAHHVEVQIAADGLGTVWALGVRDCSVQRRKQKVLEESASAVLDPTAVVALRTAAASVCRAAGYRGVGTVEFLHDPHTHRSYFMEVNPRLQVEHTVTEVATGVDLVALQLDLAAGAQLPATCPPERGHAIEVRLNAEDAGDSFTPAPGRLLVMRSPGGPGVRVDAGMREGDVVPAAFDSMIAKVIAWGADRGQALARLRRALEELVVVVEGGTSNRTFLLALVSDPDVASSATDVTWLDRRVAEGCFARTRHAGLALVVAAIEAYELELAAQRQHLISTASRGRPDLRPLERSTDVAMRGTSHRLGTACIGPATYAVTTPDGAVTVHVERSGEHESRVAWERGSARVVSSVHGAVHRIEIEDEGHRIVRGDAGLVRSRAPALVVAIKIAPGQPVAEGAALVVLEAMKMEMTVAAPFDGIVRDVLVRPNVQVDAGDPLVHLEPVEDGRASHDGAGDDVVTFPVDGAGTAGPPDLASEYRALRQLLLGYDAPVGPSALLDAITARQVDAGDRDVEVIEDELLALVVDVCAVSGAAMPDDHALPGPHAGEQLLFAFLRAPERGRDTLPRDFLVRLEHLVRRHGLAGLDRSPALDDALLRVFRASRDLGRYVPHIVAVLDRRLRSGADPAAEGAPAFGLLLDELIAVTEHRFPELADHARAVRHRWFDEPVMRRVAAAARAALDEHLTSIAADPGSADREDRLSRLVAGPSSLRAPLAEWVQTGPPAAREAALEVQLRRAYRTRPIRPVVTRTVDRRSFATTSYERNGRQVNVVATHGSMDELPVLLAALAAQVAAAPPGDAVADLLLWDDRGDTADPSSALRAALDAADLDRPVRRVDVTIEAPRRAGQRPTQLTFREADGHFAEDLLHRDLHPMLAKRLELWRLADFALERLPATEGIVLLRATARSNPLDERLFALAEVRDLTSVDDDAGQPVGWPELERTALAALSAIRLAQVERPMHERLLWNRLVLYVEPPWDISDDDVRRLAHRLAPGSEGVGLEKVIVRAHVPDGAGRLVDTVLHVSNPTMVGVSVGRTPPSNAPIRPQTAYRQRVLRVQRRGETAPYEVVRLLTSPSATEADFPVGTFTELDLDDEGVLRPVERPHGENVANVVVGRISNRTADHPEGMERVIILGDPGKRLGALAEPECRRIIAALDVAEEAGVPVEWFSLSAGALVAMDSGTENMDWTAAVLRRIVGFTQAGHEINIIVTGVNVGAQSYWNAEATMLMHTRGILVMVPGSSMVLTGKQALDMSGGVSAEDNTGIGGFERVMGPNGEAQFWAHSVEAACALLFRHYQDTYVACGERFPRRRPTSDPVDRDIRDEPHTPAPGTDFTIVGDVFDDVRNPDRKKPFDIRSVMRAVVDRDAPPVERWAGWAGAETGIVWDVRIGGLAACLLGVESHPLERRGILPADGPESWTGGTLFPLSSKKLSRAINAASGNRPLVVLANLSGFDGSPEALRNLQLEYGAEIGRAVVNFDGPIVFCVISRYHGGAFVVFSKRLNDSVEVAAIEGSRASVLGGAPAAAVVFGSEVTARTRADERVRALERQVEAAAHDDRAALQVQLEDVRRAARDEHVGAVAAEFDAIHTIERALRVGSVDHVIPAAGLRPYLVTALERGMARSGAPTRDRTLPERG